MRTSLSIGFLALAMGAVAYAQSPQPTAPAGSSEKQVKVLESENSKLRVEKAKLQAQVAELQKQLAATKAEAAEATKAAKASTGPATPESTAKAPTSMKKGLTRKQVDGLLGAGEVTEETDAVIRVEYEQDNNDGGVNNAGSSTVWNCVFDKETGKLMNFSKTKQQNRFATERPR